MQVILRDLETKPILKHEHVFAIRDNIQKKFSAKSQRERAIIFARAIHKIIDGHIQEFEEKQRDRIRTDVLRNAVLENNYNIYADAVFRACLEVRDNDRQDMESLARWVSRLQGVPVTGEILRSLTHEFCHSAVEDPAVLSCLAEKQVPVSTVIVEGRLTTNDSAEVPINQGTNFETVASAAAVSWSTAEVRHKTTSRLLTAFLIIMVILLFQLPQDLFYTSIAPAISGRSGEKPAAKVDEMGKYSETILPVDLFYRDIDPAKLESSLRKRNSVLAGEPYLSALIQAGEEFNVNPLFLIAITGQEQSFVPSTDKDARVIANNPFNVHHSWKKYNTNIRDSARIAAETVAVLSKDRPEDVHPVAWINRMYAEDTQWWIGVSRIFLELKTEVEEQN
ncbi:hypothetical protein [Desulforamulus aquiferis]|uniref:Mannosyl-glycoprotein endo-beta-N-acetylglucosamidase-like domain-containing protein n=1 Tax=Desulforamulus aquiferis TaxID=1397668 RepID=A0AAW7Z9X3_9FIRM|nr:hypothetical protein [Desulforamulus aquiferis]MDO7785871.1 hypothetical protein [Desulforamulus aquiferis]